LNSAYSPPAGSGATPRQQDRTRVGLRWACSLHATQTHHRAAWGPPSPCQPTAPGPAPPWTALHPPRPNLTLVRVHVVGGVHAAADGPASKDLGADLEGASHLAVLRDRQAVVVVQGLAAVLGPAREALGLGIALRGTGAWVTRHPAAGVCCRALHLSSTMYVGWSCLAAFGGVSDAAGSQPAGRRCSKVALVCHACGRLAGLRQPAAHLLVLCHIKVARVGRNAMLVGVLVYELVISCTAAHSDNRR
jgi:hypothetical protein